MAKQRGGEGGLAHSHVDAPWQEETAEFAQEPPNPIRKLLRFLGSLKLAVVLLLVSMLASATASGTSRGVRSSKETESRFPQVTASALCGTFVTPGSK